MRENSQNPGQSPVGKATWQALCATFGWGTHLAGENLDLSPFFPLAELHGAGMSQTPGAHSRMEKSENLEKQDF